MPSTPETDFLKELVESTKALGLMTGATGVFGSPSVSVRSDSLAVDVLNIIRAREADVTKVKFTVHCHADEKEGIWQTLSLAGVPEAHVRFNIV
jgi:hypothetical protein